MELKDTTLRSIIFNQPIIELIEKNGKYENKNKVTNEKFNVYLNCLVSLAKTSLLVYLDSGILRKVLIEHFHKSTSIFNSEIKKLREKYNNLRIEPSNEPRSIKGLPSKAFIIDNKNNKTTKKPLAIYVSTPKGLVFLCMSGSRLKSPFKPDDLIISFKGTSTKSDLQADIMAQFSKEDLNKYIFGEETGHKVASSFLKLLDDGIQILEKIVSSYKPKRLFLTGHSLGGAISSIFSLICAFKKVPYSIHNITFGSPTIFSSGLRNIYNEYLDSRKITLDRVVARIPNGVVDIITTLPLGYSHPGFQPGTFEINYEKTGRVFTLESVKKNYVGGSESKDLYHKETLNYMPNRLLIDATSPGTIGHGSYLDIEFRNSFRKDKSDIASSLETGIFYCNIYEDGIRFNYDGELQLPKKT